MTLLLIKSAQHFGQPVECQAFRLCLPVKRKGFSSRPSFCQLGVKCFPFGPPDKRTSDVGQGVKPAPVFIVRQLSSHKDARHSAHRTNNIFINRIKSESSSGNCMQFNCNRRKWSSTRNGIEQSPCSSILYIFFGLNGVSFGS